MTKPATLFDDMDKAPTLTTAPARWVSAVNHDVGFRCWALLEITDPWGAKNLIRKGMRR